MKARLKQPSLLIRKILFAWVALVLFFPIPGYSQEAEVASYPNRPITFIIPLPPGVASEISLRLLTKNGGKNILDNPSYP